MGITVVVRQRNARHRPALNNLFNGGLFRNQIFGSCRLVFNVDFNRLQIFFNNLLSNFAAAVIYNRLHRSTDAHPKIFWLLNSLAGNGYNPFVKRLALFDCFANGKARCNVLHGNTVVRGQPSMPYSFARCNVCKLFFAARRVFFSQLYNLYILVRLEFGNTVGLVDLDTDNNACYAQSPCNVTRAAHNFVRAFKHKTVVAR